MLPNDIRSLNILLSEDYFDNSFVSESPSSLLKKLESARQQVLDIEHKLSNVKKRMSGDLALILRKTEPGLNIAVEKDGCSVGYMSKCLNFSPDFEAGVWKVTSRNKRFMREFLNSYRKSTIISGDQNEICNNILSYYKSYFRSLNEEIVGTGILILESHKCTVSGLVSWSREIND